MERRTFSLLRRCLSLEKLSGRERTNERRSVTFPKNSIPSPKAAEKFSLVRHMLRYSSERASLPSVFYIVIAAPSDLDTN